MAMYKTWEEGRAETRAEGSLEAQAKDILTVLQVRSIVVSDAARQRIQAETDPEQLERWLPKAAVASSIADVIDDPS